MFDVNGLRFGAGGVFRGDTVNRTVGVDLKYGIHIPSLKTLLDLIPEAVLQKAEGVDVRGEVWCKGEVKGTYGRQNIPLLTSEFRIQDGYIAYPGMPSQIDSLNVDLYAFVDLQKEQDSYIRLRQFCIQGGGTDVDIKGDIEHLLTDPLVKTQIEAQVNFGDLTRIFPLTDGITCKGMLNTFLKTNVKVSDILCADYGKLNVGGYCRMKGVEIFIPKDSIVMKMKSATLAFASNRKNEKTLQGKDLLNGVVGYSGMDVHIRNKVRF